MYNTGDGDEDDEGDGDEAIKDVCKWEKSSDEIKDKNTQPYTTPLYFMNSSFEKNDGRWLENSCTHVPEVGLNTDKCTDGLTEICPQFNFHQVLPSTK